jgi:hypothetical protein
MVGRRKVIPHESAQDPRFSELRIAIVRAAGLGKSAAEIRALALQFGAIVSDPPLSEEQVDETLQDQLLRLTPRQSVDAPPVIPDDDLPPRETTDARGSVEIDAEAEFEERPDGTPKNSAPRHHVLKWISLADQEPPEFEWLLDDWLSWHPTLLSGRGGIGKSLLAQQIATGLAMAVPVFRSPPRALRVLYWACEDDEAELWRRQKRICAWLGIELGSLHENLIIDARLGLENTLFATEYGRPTWTPLIAELEQQVNDYKADVLMLDNIGQVFGANENDRHHVTSFANGIIGMVRGRNFCPIFMGHPAKVSGSEYAGNAAWENAVRMRWFLSDRLPDDVETEDRDELTRYLCKRKANYSGKDYIRFRFEDRVLKPAEQELDNRPRDIVDALRDKSDERIVIEGLQWINGRGFTASEQAKGSNSLVGQILKYKRNEGRARKELEQALIRLLSADRIKRAEVGKYANRTPKFGLVLTENSAQS